METKFRNPNLILLFFILVTFTFLYSGPPFVNNDFEIILTARTQNRDILKQLEKLSSDYKYYKPDENPKEITKKLQISLSTTKYPKIVNKTSTSEENILNSTVLKLVAEIDYLGKSFCYPQNFIPETRVVFLVPEDCLLFCVGRGFNHAIIKDESLESVNGWCLCTNETKRESSSAEVESQTCKLFKMVPINWSKSNKVKNCWFWCTVFAITFGRNPD